MVLYMEVQRKHSVPLTSIYVPELSGYLLEPDRCCAKRERIQIGALSPAYGRLPPSKETNDILFFI